MRISDWSSDVCSSDLVARQLLPGIQVDEVVEHRRRLVPARVVVELGGLVEAEGEVVVGADPLGRIDGAGLQGRGNLAARQRSEERRVGKEGGSPCRSRWSPEH